jgi:AcrR family transcriptional regulator
MSDLPLNAPETSHDVSGSTDTPTVSIVALRERKKDQTREALARAAFELFQSKGYEGTTVAEIARAANVSRRTFFRYYSSKDALLFVDDSENLEQFRELLNLREPSDDSFAHVRRACMALAEAHVRDRDQQLARARIIDSSPALGKQERQQDLSWERAIADSLLSNRNPVAERRARMLAGAVFGAMRAAISTWYELDGRADLPRLMSEALELFGPRVHEFEPAHATSN